MGFSISIRPRVSDTDMLGHINNVAVVAWLEEGRTYLMRQFLDPQRPTPAFVVARLEIDYKAELHFGHEITVDTTVERFGERSMTVLQEILQDGKICTIARVVLVHFDRELKRSTWIPDALRELLAPYRREPD